LDVQLNDKYFICSAMCGRMELKMNRHNEGYETGNPYRTTYRDGIDALIQRRKKQADIERKKNLANMISDQEQYRCDFINMLGWPLNREKSGFNNIEITHVATDDLKEIYRIQLSVLDDMQPYAILMLPVNRQTPCPVSLALHGGMGTPELVSGFHDNVTLNYHHMVTRVLEQGVAVLAPQLLLWEEEKYTVPFDRKKTDLLLKQLGGSIVGLEIFVLKSWVDYLFTRKDLLVENLGIVGLSYGSFYSLYTAAADVRIKSIYASCHFNDRFLYNIYDGTWFNSAFRFLDAEVGALICPRRLYIELSNDDELFAPEPGINEFRKLEKVFFDNGVSENLRLSVFEGVHEFNPGGDGIEFLVEKMLQE